RGLKRTGTYQARMPNRDKFWLTMRNQARSNTLTRVFAAFFLCVTVVAGQEPLQVTTTVNESSIAGRPVALDSRGKLLPWPMPDSTGYSYSAYFFSQWTIVWD